MRVSEVLQAHEAQLDVVAFNQNTNYVDRWRNETDTAMSEFICRWRVEKGIRTDITAEQISVILSCLRNRQNSAFETVQQVANEMQ